ncbi:hypothetical protein IFM89_038874 [Coptis chinensis]|uniref:Condensin complex subunit 2 n=1 Tax=Coptis chinensis TaxID=261450 RepID=A0A835I8I5_9MAGN|nr:hypothetical protein IFM89_038874 [Coptis chinensis]
MTNSNVHVYVQQPFVIKSILVVSPPPLQSQSDPLCFKKEQITELFTNCIKLASENKINQKNTWELRLIDHICEIIRIDTQDDNDEKLISKRQVVHWRLVLRYMLRELIRALKRYKVLGGINRAGRDDVQEKISRTVIKGADKGEGHSKKDVDRKMSPLSTLESSFEALNVKKFDVAFVVDPLYHQTSAQFDEGGAKGLLLNNLGVYGGCRVVFDSFEVPGKSLGFSSNKKCRAGPDHWKFRKVKGLKETSESKVDQRRMTKKPNCRKQVEPDLNFTNCLEKEMPDIFAPPKNLKSLLLPANRKCLVKPHFRRLPLSTRKSCEVVSSS